MLVFGKVMQAFRLSGYLSCNPLTRHSSYMICSEYISRLTTPLNVFNYAATRFFGSYWDDSNSNGQNAGITSRTSSKEYEKRHILDATSTTKSSKNTFKFNDIVPVALISSQRFNAPPLKVLVIPISLFKGDEGRRKTTDTLSAIRRNYKEIESFTDNLREQNSATYAATSDKVDDIEEMNEWLHWKADASPEENAINTSPKSLRYGHSPLIDKVLEHYSLSNPKPINFTDLKGLSVPKIEDNDVSFRSQKLDTLNSKLLNNPLLSSMANKLGMINDSLDGDPMQFKTKEMEKKKGFTGYKTHKAYSTNSSKSDAKGQSNKLTSAPIKSAKEADQASAGNAKNSDYEMTDMSELSEPNIENTISTTIVSAKEADQASSGNEMTDISEYDMTDVSESGPQIKSTIPSRPCRCNIIDLCLMSCDAYRNACEKAAEMRESSTATKRRKPEKPKKSISVTNTPTLSFFKALKSKELKLLGTETKTTAPPSENSNPLELHNTQTKAPAMLSDKPKALDLHSTETADDSASFDKPKVPDLRTPPKKPKLRRPIISSLLDYLK